MVVITVTLESVILIRVIIRSAHFLVNQRKLDFLPPVSLSFRIRLQLDDLWMLDCAHTCWLKHFCLSVEFWMQMQDAQLSLDLGIKLFFDLISEQI